MIAGRIVSVSTLLWPDTRLEADQHPFGVLVSCCKWYREICGRCQHHVIIAAHVAHSFLTACEKYSPQQYLPQQQEDTCLGCMLVSRSASLTDSNRTISASLRAVASEMVGGQAMIAAQARILLGLSPRCSNLPHNAAKEHHWVQAACSKPVLPCKASGLTTSATGGPSAAHLPAGMFPAQGRHWLPFSSGTPCSAL